MVDKVAREMFNLTSQQADISLLAKSFYYAGLLLGKGNKWMFANFCYNIYFPGLNKTLTSPDFGEVLTKNMWDSRIEDSAGDFTMSSNGDRLVRYAVLALNQTSGTYMLASTFQIEEEQKCSDTEKANCTYISGEKVTKLVNITWPGSCEDRIYRETAIRRSGDLS
jgi:hypothetical protein